MLSFPPFRLEPAKSRLWKGDEEIPLRRKPLAILRYLAEHAQRLVTHEELVHAIWGNVTVSESLLRTHVHELRTVLGENVIETVVGRGYRFVPPVVASEGDVRDPRSERSGFGAAHPMFGRDGELARLGEALERSLRRERQVVFLTGEAGIGKTTLVDGLLARAASAGPAWIAYGRCVEQYGSGEPYLPVLGAFGRLCRGPDGAHVVDILSRRAPTWLVQMPGLISDERLEGLQRRLVGTARDRMLRELAEAIEALSTEKAFVLALDDLHWSDGATIDLLATLAAWSESARLLVVGTYRRGAVPKSHPLIKLVAELCGHAKASIVSLEGLPRPALEQYLSARFPGHEFPAEIGAAIQRTTAGNPLYMIALLDDLETRRMIERQSGRWRLTTSVDEVVSLRPETVTKLIDVGIGRLEEGERRILEAASVAGGAFAAGVVAHALDVSVDLVDSTCETLAKERRLFLREAGTERWPDGTVQARYAFAHALYEHAAFSRVSSSTRRSWHRRIAERLEAAWGDSAASIATELALHFEKAEEPAKAARYHILAGERDGDRFAGAGALERFEHARGLLAGLPRTRERDALELKLLLEASRMLIVSQDAGRTDLGATFERGAALAQRVGDDESLATTLTGLQALRLGRGAFAEVMENAAAVDEVADRVGDPLLVARAKIAPALAHMFRGDLADAQRALAVVHANTQRHEPGARSAHMLGAPAQPVVVSGAYLAMLSWLLGRPDAAKALADDTVMRARSFGDPYSLSMAWSSAAVVHRWRRDVASTIEAASRAWEVATEYRLPRWKNRATILLTWARCQGGAPTPADTARDLEKAHEGVVASAPVMRTWVTGPFVETCALLGRVEPAMRELAQGLDFAEKTGERAWEPEIHRLRGELVKSTNAREAVRCFDQAIALAERQSSKSFLLRAATSRHRLSIGTKEQARSREMLERVYQSFGEGFDTGDLVEARSLLA